MLFWFSRLTLRTKLNLLIFLLFTTFVGTNGVAFFYRIDDIYEKRKQEMLEEKKQEIIEKVNIVHRLVSSVYQHHSKPENIERVHREKILAVMDSALSIISKRYEKLKQQGLPDHEIQADLKDILRNLRYDNGNGYIFTYDFEGTLVSHADKALDGKNLYNLEDAKGFYFVQSMVNIGKTTGEGFVHYHWRKLGYKEPKQKISYMKLFKPYNWILGTGIYIEDTEDLIKQQIADLLTAYRYNLGKTQNNYLFVIGGDGSMIRHPASPKLIGTNVLNIRDTHGKLFIQDFIKTVDEEKQGFVSYTWPKPDQPDVFAEKLTFVKEFEPFNWIIGTGIYLEDIGIEEMHAVLEQEAKYIIWTSVFIGLVFLLIGSITSMSFIDFVTRPLIQARHVAERIAKGDFSKRTSYRSKDEIGELSSAINSMAKQLQSSFTHLMSLNKEKDEFLSIAAHDLKNPLQAIQGSAELIEMSITSEQFEGKQDIVEFASMISVSAERMFDLITNLLEVNIIEAGQLKANLVEVNVLPILQKIVYDYQRKAAPKNIRIHFSPESKKYIAHTDENVIYQVLDNLVSNAVKYSPLDKRIFIRISNQDYQIRIEIQDEGLGLSQKDQDKLFGKFTRLTAKPTGGEHSTGLGLFIVKKLVTILQGVVWCESKLGQGATFILTLPKTADATLTKTD
ncbi:cache domain-containing protein [Candidatus Albibeggiatoa sp. nov. NOAA]|uniref:cache domain-containing protein n=1 Tax=Candidatus Albibeggiatoa sp. nov. NOAA TaxID=3162724 RepID=UPI0033054B07|nr:cache domain-containing protein [Thiotrichaceae bacterium]